MDAMGTGANEPTVESKTETIKRRICDIETQLDSNIERLVAIRDHLLGIPEPDDKPTPPGEVQPPSGMLEGLSDTLDSVRQRLVGEGEIISELERV